MKKFLIVIFFVGILGSLLLRFDPMKWRSFRSHSIAEIQLLLKEYEKRLDTMYAEHERLSLAPIDTRDIGAEGKRARDLLYVSEMIQGYKYQADMLRRERTLRETLGKYYLGSIRPDYLPLILSALSFILYLLMIINEKIRRPFPLFLGKVSEIPDLEQYIPEGDLPRKIETGFPSKQEAEQWLRNDPNLICEYCGGKMSGTSVGTIQQITFYKKVPPGLKDMRVKLGTYWYARPSPLLTCSSCGKELHR